jgi:hypothetical protein
MRWRGPEVDAVARPGGRCGGVVLAPCFQIATAQAAPKKTQQNFKNTYCRRNNLS